MKGGKNSLEFHSCFPQPHFTHCPREHSRSRAHPMNYTYKLEHMTYSQSQFSQDKPRNPY